MGKHCCEQGLRHLDHHHAHSQLKLTNKHLRVLSLILGLNVLMMCSEAVGGWMAHSHSILADSVHLLGHVFIVSLSIFSVSRGLIWKARAALLNGLMNLFLAGAILFDALKTVEAHSTLPESDLMVIVSLLSVLANSICLLVLRGTKNDDINMEATWLCTRNDLLTNIGIVVTSTCVVLTQSHWPDTLVAILLSIVVGRSAIFVLQRAVTVLQGSDIKFVRATSPAIRRKS